MISDKIADFLSYMEEQCQMYDIAKDMLKECVEDITSGDVDKYKYTLNFNTNMWIPIGGDYID